MFISAIADHERSVIQNDVRDSCYFSVLADGSTGIIEQQSLFVQYIGKQGEV